MHKYFTLFVSCALFFSGCQENFDVRLEREAREFTQLHCPSPVEPGNTLDSATYDISSRTFTRWYTLNGQLDTPLTHQTALQNLDKVKQQLLFELQADMTWNACKEEQIDFAYVYLSAHLKKELFRIILTPDDYE